MTAFREFGDQYGSHALKAAGGDNVQQDVLHVVGESGVRRFAIHPTRLNADYVGAHRSTPDTVWAWLGNTETAFLVNR